MNAYVTDTSTCSSCGNADQGALIHVVDELGRTDICGLCVITLLARNRGSGDVTVFVALPTALST